MLVVGRLLSQQAELGSKFCVPLQFTHIHPLSDQIDRRGMQIGCFYTRACFICYCLASTLLAAILSYSLSRIYSIASETSTTPGPSKVILKPRFTTAHGAPFVAATAVAITFARELHCPPSYRFMSRPSEQTLQQSKG